jgi:microcystin-dependent protein
LDNQGQASDWKLIPEAFVNKFRQNEKRRAGMHPVKFWCSMLCLIIICALTSIPGSIAQEANSGNTTTFPGDVVVNGEILGIGMVPPGGIVMFSGDIAKAFDAEGTGRKETPYAGWQLCNGKNGSPDLQDRFVAAAGRSYKIGDRQGADSIALTTDQLPVHGHAGQTAASGSHQHWIEGTDAKGLAKRRRRIPGQTTVDMGFGGGRNADPGDVRWRGAVNTDNVGSHIHGFNTAATGKGHPHENRPSFYALAFIMRLPSSPAER